MVSATSILALAPSTAWLMSVAASLAMAVVIVDQGLQRLAAVEPDVVRPPTQGGLGRGGVAPFGRIEVNLGSLFVSCVKFLERRETDAIVRARDGRFIQLFKAVEALGGVLVLGQQAASLAGVVGGHDLPGQDGRTRPKCRACPRCSSGRAGHHLRMTSLSCSMADRRL